MGIFGQHTAVWRQVAAQFVESTARIATDFSEFTGSAHQCRGAPQRRTDEQRFPLDLRIARESRLIAGHLRYAEIYQIAEIVCGETEFERHRSVTCGALGLAFSSGAAERLRSCPQDRFQTALASQRADHLATAAIGQQSKRAIYRRLARAVRAGDDGEPAQRQDDLTQ